ncbi:hypothetical protein ACOMHN_064397 [Nucella lapillus]
MLGHRPSTDPVPGPDLGPSLTQQEIQPSEKAVSSKVAAATVADVTDHNRLETVTHDNKDKDHDGPPDSPSDDVQHSPSMDPDGGDAAVSTSVETPDIPTSTGSILAPSDVNGVDPQVDTDLSTDDREGKSPGAAVPQAASGELPVQTDRKSRSRRATVTRKPRALSQTNLLDKPSKDEP